MTDCMSIWPSVCLSVHVSRWWRRWRVWVCVWGCVWDLRYCMYRRWTQWHLCNICHSIKEPHKTYHTCSRKKNPEHLKLLGKLDCSRVCLKAVTLVIPFHRTVNGILFKAFRWGVISMCLDSGWIFKLDHWYGKSLSPFPSMLPFVAFHKRAQQP